MEPLSRCVWRSKSKIDDLALDVEEVVKPRMGKMFCFFFFFFNFFCKRSSSSSWAIESELSDGKPPGQPRLPHVLCTFALNKPRPLDSRFSALVSKGDINHFLPASSEPPPPFPELHLLPLASFVRLLVLSPTQLAWALLPLILNPRAERQRLPDVTAPSNPTVLTLGDTKANP